MAGFTRRFAERVADATVRVERSDLGQRTKRSKYPVGGGGPRFKLCKADAAVTKGNSGTFSIYKGSTLGSETDTGENVTAYVRMGDIQSGAWCYVIKRPGGWEAFVAECDTGA